MHACRFSTNCNHVAVFYQHVYQCTVPSSELNGGGQAGAEERGSGQKVIAGALRERPDITYADTLQASGGRTCSRDCMRCAAASGAAQAGLRLLAAGRGRAAAA